MNRKLLVALLMSVSLLSLGGFVVAGQDSTGNVPMFRGNPAHTGEMPGPGPDPKLDIDVLWAFDARDYFSSPAVVDGVVYISSYEFDGDSGIYAIDATSGLQRWVLTTELYLSSPAVVDGVVYVGSTHEGLLAIDAATGQKLWVFETPTGIDSSPVVVDGAVYVEASGFVYAIDAASGQQRWARDLQEGLSNPAVANGVVYVGTWRGDLEAIDAASGEVLGLDFSTYAWRNSSSSGLSSPSVADGVVYVTGDDADNVDHLYAVDATTGQQLWVFTTASGPSDPAVADGVVYVGGGDGLYAIDAASGQQTWVFTNQGSLSSPVVVNGMVFARSGHTLYAINSLSDDDRALLVEAQMTATTTSAAWESYFPSINQALGDAAGNLAGVNFGPATLMLTIDPAFVPPITAHSASYPATIASGTENTWVALAVYASKDEADAALNQMKESLQRSGWQEAQVDGLDHDHVCLTLVHDETSQGICYMTRDDTLIVSYSYLDVDAPEAALQNAIDLARLMNDAYDQVDRPE